MPVEPKQGLDTYIDAASGYQVAYKSGPLEAGDLLWE